MAITVTAPDKASLENSKQTLTREARSFVLRVPVPAGQSAGDYIVRITTKPVGATLGTTETLRVVLPESAGGRARWPSASRVCSGAGRSPGRRSWRPATCGSGGRSA